MSVVLGEDIDLVLFDHDDTLVQTLESKKAHHQHVAKQFYDKDLTDEEVHEHWGKPLPTLVGLLYSTDDIESALANNASCHEDFPKAMPSYTIPKVTELHNAGFKLGVITATIRFSFEHDLHLHNFPTELLSYTQTADDTDFHKPDGRVFEPLLKWAAAESIDSERIVYIGDGLQDMEAARDAGLRFIGVGSGLVTVEQFQAHGVRAVSNIGDLVVR